MNKNLYTERYMLYCRYTGRIAGQDKNLTEYSIFAYSIFIANMVEEYKEKLSMKSTDSISDQEDFTKFIREEVEREEDHYEKTNKTL